MQLVLRYTLFAILATIANIGSQELTVTFYTGQFAITLSILVGTAVGLIVKYWLDKHYIFSYQTRNLAHDSHTFFIYTLVGGLTTFIFWGFEFGFEYIFHSKEMRYLGGVIGLGIGYFLKYQLDKKFVFIESFRDNK